MRIHIYALVDPIKYEIRYVGYSKDPIDRLEGHIKESLNIKKKNEGNKHKKNWIRKLYNNGLLPILEILEECNEETYEAREIYWITYCKEIGCKLVNKTIGGDSVLGLKYTKEQKERSRIAAIERWKDPEKHEIQSKKAKERLKDPTNHPMYGIRMTEEQKKKHGERMSGENNPMHNYEWTEEQKKNLSDKIKTWHATHKHPMKDKKGKDNPNTGRKHSIEAINNLIEGQRKRRERERKVHEPKDEE